MKPIMLKMGAFGPFAKEIQIPFSQMGTHGIFLITGETGAGKTTIFDGISFALFGLSSGQNRNIDFFHSDFSKREDKTYVELTFLHREQSYVVTRNLAYQKNKARGQGTTSVGKNAQLLLPDGQMITGYKQVTEEIEAILGLSWSHFKQIAMIAQGEFLNLLFADTKERSEILRKVFGTEIYLDFQNRLRSMAIEQYKKCEESDRSAVQYLTGILVGESMETTPVWVDFKKTKDVHKIQAMEIFLEHILLQDLKQQKALEAAYKSTKSALEKNIIQYTNGEKLNSQFAQLEKEREVEQCLKEREDKIVEIKVQLEIGKDAYYKVLPRERAYLLAKEEQIKISEKIQLDWVHVLECEKCLSVAHEEQKDTKVYEKKLEVVQEDITKWEMGQKNFLILEDLEKEKGLWLKKKETCAINKKKWMQELEKLEEDYNKGIQQLESLNEIETKELELIHAWNLQVQTLEKIEVLQKEYEQLQVEKEKLIVLQTNYQAVEQKYALEMESYQIEERAFFGAQAGILASKLKDGDLCPVCGSTHHPNLALLEDATITQDALEKKKRRLEKTQEKVVYESNQCHIQKERVQQVDKSVWKGLLNIQTERHTDTNILIEELLVCEQERYSQLQKEKDILDSKKVEQEQLLKIKKTLELKRVHLQEQQEITKEQWEEIESAHHILEGKIQMLQNSLSFSSKQELELCLKDAMAQKKLLQVQIEKNIINLQEAEKNLSNAKVVYEMDQVSENAIREKEKVQSKEFKEILEHCKFESVVEYQTALPEESLLQELDKTVQTYERSVLQNKTILEQLLVITEGKKVEELFQLEEEKIVLTETIRNQEEALREIHNRRTTNGKIQREIKKLQDKQGTAKEEYIVIQKLAKVANGETKERIAFEQYVQAFYFNQIIQAANIRFHEMTNGQFELVRRQDATDRRSLNGLELDVMDYYTGRKRPVKSLSGGESFKASLSLALGLSDMIQGYAGGIKIDTLFIDEGFGALDGESLEQAMQTLHKLAGGNRFVGIISHVSELKEKIEKKIIITKTMEGSTVQMVQ